MGAGAKAAAEPAMAARAAIFIMVAEIFREWQFNDCELVGKRVAQGSAAMTWELVLTYSW